MSEKLCSVNSEGHITFIIEGTIPTEIPKVKHPLRELHPDYKNHLKQDIAERVDLKKQIITANNEKQKLKVEFERKLLKNCKQNIEKWFNV